MRTLIKSKQWLAETTCQFFPHSEHRFLAPSPRRKGLVNHCLMFRSLLARRQRQNLYMQPSVPGSKRLPTWEAPTLVTARKRDGLQNYCIVQLRPDAQRVTLAVDCVDTAACLKSMQAWNNHYSCGNNREEPTTRSSLSWHGCPRKKTGKAPPHHLHHATYSNS